MSRIIKGKWHELDQDYQINAQCRISAAKNKNRQIIKLNYVKYQVIGKSEAQTQIKK